MDLAQDAALALMPAVREAAREAGRIACRYFRRGDKTTARVWSKHGGSPVTEADVAVDSFLKVRLAEALPDAAWLSEETTDDPVRLGARRLWVVDPIDGTRAFLSGHPDWSVVIALLVDGEPALGIVHAPAHDTLYEACRRNGAFRDGARITVSGMTALHGARIAGPKPLIDRLRRAAGPFEQVERIPSLALRLVRVAEGAVDLGLVSSNAHDWDFAAADLILAEAGGRLSTFEGERPRYNQVEPVHGELLAAPRALHPHLIEAMTGRSPSAAAP
ncbi:MAG TPA: 3'(2'),5'-bisphosphate nucleotidase CysQ [Beijerinckiaceae bacterium]